MHEFAVLLIITLIALLFQSDDNASRGVYKFFLGGGREVVKIYFLQEKREELGGTFLMIYSVMTSDKILIPLTI